MSKDIPETARGAPQRVVNVELATDGRVQLGHVLSTDTLGKRDDQRADKHALHAPSKTVCMEIAQRDRMVRRARCLSGWACSVGEGVSVKGTGLRITRFDLSDTRSRAHYRTVVTWRLQAQPI